jgi:hypothetical protein
VDIGKLQRTLIEAVEGEIRFDPGSRSAGRSWDQMNRLR